MWTESMETILRAEVEKRFRFRTPAPDVLSADWRSRVPRSEIRFIAETMCGEMPPDKDREWGVAFAKWYIRMAKKALRELDEDWREILKRMPPAPAWTREA